LCLSPVMKVATLGVLSCPLVRLRVGGMAPLVLTDDEAKAAMLLGSSEFKYLLCKEQVTVLSQAKLFHSGVVTSALLGAIAEDVNDFKRLLKEEFGVDPGVSMAMRLETARLLIVYNSAVVRAAKKIELDGELEARHLPKQVSKTEFASMKEAWEARWWALEDAETPSRAYVERRADELEQGNFRAEPLKMVINREQEDPGDMQPVWDQLGTIKMRRVAGTVEEPGNPEQLRKRIALMGIALMMLGIRHSNRDQLQGIVPQLFHTYLNYLLGLCLAADCSRPRGQYGQLPILGHSHRL